MGRRSGLGSWMVLFRAGNAVTGIFGVLLGAVLATQGIPSGEKALITALHCISVMTFMFGWNAVNDLLDVEIDRINRPERPLPSAEITISAARTGVAITGALSLSSMFCAGYLAHNGDTGIEGWAPAPLIWAAAILLMFNYESSSRFSMRLKDRGLPGNVAISMSVGMVILFGAAGVSRPFDSRAWAIFIIGFTYNLAREIVKDIEDMHGDKGRETLAMQAGPERARTVSWMILLVTLALVLLSFSQGLFPKPHLILVIPSVIALLMVKQRLFAAEDHAAQMMIKRSMQLCLGAFLVSSLAQ